MIPRTWRRTVAALATATFLTTPLVGASSAPTAVASPARAAQAASKSLTCSARVSDSTPRQHTTVKVYVKTGKPTAKVKAVAHYKTTSRTKSKTSNGSAKATLSFYIASAKAGRPVRVSVTVKKDGKTRTCSTHFTPHK